MKMKEEVAKLKSIDIYSFMLFALYKISDIKEYSAISELAYVLDKENLLKLCEYFGGTTIQIPTIDELKSIIYALILYQYVDIEKMSYDDAIKVIGNTTDEMKQIKHTYAKIKEVIDGYEFSRREK